MNRLTDSNMQDDFKQGRNSDLATQSKGSKVEAINELNQELRDSVQNLETKGINLKIFGAVGDGSNDDTSAIQSAFDYANQNGFTLIEVPGGVYRVDGNIVGYTNVSLKGLGNVIWDFSQRASYSTREKPFLGYFGTVGTPVNLSADITFLDNSITVSDASQFQPGDLIEISTHSSGSGEHIWDDTSVTVRRAEIVQVKSVSGNTIYLNEPLVDQSGYLVTDTVSVKKVEPIENVTIENITFKGKGRPSTGSGDIGVLLKYGINIKVVDCEFIDVDKRGLEFISCHTFYADSNTFVHPEKGANEDTNYSMVTTSASRHGFFRNNTSKNPRHGITTSHVSSAATDFVPGVNRFMTFEGNQIFNTWHAGISMHSDVEHVSILNNDCVSCYYGIEARERNVVIKGNRIIKSKSSSIGIYVNKNVRNLVISENNIIGGRIYVTNLDTFRTSANLTISNNVVSDVLNESFAIQVEANTDVKLTSLNITGNTISRFTGVGGNSAGIRLLGNISGAVFNNEVRGTTNGTGVRIYAGVNNLVFSSNRIINSSSYGVAIESSTYSNLHLLNNLVVGYTGAYISGISNATSSSGNIDGGSTAV